MALPAQAGAMTPPPLAARLAAGYASDEAAAIGLFTAAVTGLTVVLLTLLGGLAPLPTDAVLLAALYGATT